ncbi:MAG: HupE/UreJ family protein, partial [Candidatus Binatia bacterium]
VEAGRLSFLWSLHCPPAGALRIRARLFEESSSTHLHFVRLRRDDGAIEERVLSAGEREWAFEEPAGKGTSVGGYVVLGIEHILGGFDHLAFVSALLLVASSLGNVARVVTGFTLAHSLTLALAATGAVRPQAAPVEALIGLSIALVAVENLWLKGTRGTVVPTLVAIGLTGAAAAAAAGVGAVPGTTLLGFALFTACYFALLDRSRRPEALRGAVAFLFGLLHGFGFAAVLAEAGLPPDRLARALLGFNVGVELGQLAVVAVLWMGLAWLSDERRSVVADAGSASVLALGTFWFVTRAFG